MPEEFHEIHDTLRRLSDGWPAAAGVSQMLSRTDPSVTEAFAAFLARKFHETGANAGKAASR